MLSGAKKCRPDGRLRRALKFRFTASPLWGKEGTGAGDSVSVRAKRLILTIAGGALLAGLVPMAPAGWSPRAAAASFPVATDSRIGGGEKPNPFVGALPRGGGRGAL